MRKKTTFLLAMLIVFVAGIVGFIGYFYFITVKTNQTNLEKLTENKLEYASQRMQNGQYTIEENASTILIEDTVKYLRDYSRPDDEHDYLNILLAIKSMLKERLINGSEMESISVYWPQKDILISTEVNLGMRKEINKPLKEGKEWRGTDKGFYYFMEYSFGNLESNETIVAIKMSDALLMDTQEAVSFDASDTVVILPDWNLVGGSPQLRESVSLVQADIKSLKRTKIIPVNNLKSRLIMNKVPKSGIVICTLLPISNNDLIYTESTIVILVTIILIVFFGSILILLYYRNVVAEMSLFTAKLKKVEQGDYDTRIEVKHNNDFGYLFNQFNQMVSSIQNLLNSLSKEMKQRELAEEKQFQAQIEPHFLYNSLFYIVSVSHNSDAVIEMTRHLVEYYRYLTKKINIVTVGEEVEFARHYLIIQSLRKEIEFAIDMDKEVENIQILPLLIQPLVENAIVHGIEAKDGAKKIFMRISLSGEICSVEVSDDGPGLNSEEIVLLNKQIELENREHVSDSVGLWNVNQRLINYYGKPSKLKFGRNMYGGLMVSFQFSVVEGIDKNETINR